MQPCFKCSSFVAISGYKVVHWDFITKNDTGYKYTICFSLLDAFLMLFPIKNMNAKNPWICSTRISELPVLLEGSKWCGGDKGHVT